VNPIPEAKPVQQMNEQKSLIYNFAEAVERYRAERRNRTYSHSNPSRLRRFLHWLTPNGGTPLLVAALPE
jgi:hypothetical protein